MCVGICQALERGCAGQWRLFVHVWFYSHMCYSHPEVIRNQSKWTCSPNRKYSTYLEMKEDQWWAVAQTSCIAEADCCGPLRNCPGWQQGEPFLEGWCGPTIQLYLWAPQHGLLWPLTCEGITLHYFTKTCSPLFIVALLYSLDYKSGNNPIVHQLMNEDTQCGISIQQNIIQS